MKTKKSKLLGIVAELGIIFAAANVLFYVSKTYTPSLGNLILSLVMLFAAIWLKAQE